MTVADDIVLTLDLGTSATKAALWSGPQLVAISRAPVATAHPEPRRAEQEPDAWWHSVVAACAKVRRAAPEAYRAVRALGFSAARETFALVDDQLRPLGPGILWSDQRADAEAAELGDPAAFRARTGVVLNGAAHIAKVAWVARHEPERLERARWILAPRDLVVARLTGTVATDPTLASRTGWYALDGELVPATGLRIADELHVADRLAPLHPSTTVIDGCIADAAHELGLQPAVHVVPGAGDRACEVLGVGADARSPMVSWGTTTNVSVPVDGPVDALSTNAAVSRGALEGFVLEAGLSASGTALGWLATLTGHPHDELLKLATSVDVGARGVLALPWLHGARAPWWRPDVHAAFLGLTPSHGPGELARAVVEAVALDVARCVELLAPASSALALAGAGASSELWRAVVAAATERSAVRHRLDDAASVGARLIVGEATGRPVALDACNPVANRTEPEPRLVEALAAVRARSDEAAAAVLGLGTVRS